jgi:hypothetical protein
MVEIRSGEAQPRQTSALPQRVLERRRSHRYPANNIGFRSTQIQASLIDVSHEGLSIESLEQPPIGTTVSFALERGRSRADADAKVCWSNLKRTYRTAAGDVVAVYRAGLRLDRSGPKMIDSITRAARLDWTAGYA